ncbi:hypothetical protein BGX23_012113 [Mortierella sp. AD031]|nr:hypothetical protein BGX23_012113 [Mortierella sp. AD031]
MKLNVALLTLVAAAASALPAAHSTDLTLTAKGPFGIAADNSWSVEWERPLFAEYADLYYNGRKYHHGKPNQKTIRGDDLLEWQYWNCV